MAASVPVVVSAVGSIPDQVRHGKEGLLVPPSALGVLGAALLRLLRDPAYARSLDETGRERAASEFSYATMLQRIEPVYRARPASCTEHNPQRAGDPHCSLSGLLGGAARVRVRHVLLLCVLCPRAVLLVAEKDQLFTGVAIERLPRPLTELVAPVSDHALAQEAPPVLLAGSPVGLALEGELLRYRARLLGA